MEFRFTNGRMDCLTEDGKPMRHITFPFAAKDLVNIDHVFTEPDFRGQGLAGQMMDALMEHLSQNGKKVILTCPYSQKYMASHPQWEGLLPQDIHFEKH